MASATSVCSRKVSSHVFSQPVEGEGLSNPLNCLPCSSF